MNSSRKKYIESCEISCVENAALGGYSQKFAIEGKKKNLPILLCLHGGPGSPVPFSVGCRGLFPEFTDQFIMVYWDQFGCGINNAPIDDSFTIEKFVKMTIDLITLLHNRFPDNKLYLFGLSWGSLLSLKAALAIPELIDGVVSFGQIVFSPMLSDGAFDAIEQSQAPKKYKRFAKMLKSEKQNQTQKNLMKFSKILRKYTNGYNNRNAKSAPVGDIIKGLLTGPDYRFKDFLAIVKNGYNKNSSLFEELRSVDLSKELESVSIPYNILQGETDIVTGTNDIKNLLKNCDNKNISFSVLPDTGHFPTENAMKEISGILSELSCRHENQSAV